MENAAIFQGTARRPAPQPAKEERPEATFFQRYLYRNYNSFSGLTEWFSRHVTATGWLVLAGAVVTSGLGADTNASPCYQTFSLLFCVLAAAAVCAPLGRPRLEVRRHPPRFGAVGEPLRYRVLARNLSGRREHALRLTENLPDPRPALRQFASTPEPGEERRNWLDRTYGWYRWRWLLARNRWALAREARLPSLAPGAWGEVEMELRPLRRGVLRLTGMTVFCPDPFGLFHSTRDAGGPESVLILPRRYPVAPFDLPGSVKYQAGGVSMSSSVGESEEFVALREYRPGDPLRRVHWKSYAKLGKPIVKEHQDEFFVRHALVLDTFGAGSSEPMFEAAVSVAASLAYTVQNQDSLLDLMFVGPEAYCFTSGRGVGRIERILEVLASVQICREKDFTVLEALMDSHAGAVSGCLCVFLNWDESRQRLVRALLARGTPVRVFVITAVEAALDPGPMAGCAGEFHIMPAGKIGERLAAL